MYFNTSMCTVDFALWGFSRTTNDDKLRQSNRTYAQSDYIAMRHEMPGLQNMNTSIFRFRCQTKFLYKFEYIFLYAYIHTRTSA